MEGVRLFQVGDTWAECQKVKVRDGANSWYTACFCLACQGSLFEEHRMSLHWGLSPGLSVYKTDALPLSYRGTYQQAPLSYPHFDSLAILISPLEFAT